MKPEAIRTGTEFQEMPDLKVAKQKLEVNPELDLEQIKEAMEKASLEQKKADAEDTELDAKKIEEFTEALNYFSLAFDQKFKFRVYSETNSIWVRVLDAETDEVLREIPSKEALKLASKIRDFMGFLIDEWA